MVHVRVDNVSVTFSIYSGVSRSLRHRLMKAGSGGRIGSNTDGGFSVRALNRVSLELKHGDRVGLIGRNGAGKTTLLRVLAGIYAPTSGRIDIQGQIAPLFDPNLGADPDSTGYENIKLRALYLGMTRKELDTKLADIAEFTELGAFLHMPLRTYSAGMQMRLAFAVSTSINPEILLLDETIGAGDAAFMEKAQTRMSELVDRAGLLVFASHANPLIRRFCNKGIVLEQGVLKFFGEVDAALDYYERPPAAAV